MSGSSSARAGAPEPDGTHPDPMSSDTRTLLIALAVMVALVAVGVTSAAVFTRSACATIAIAAVEPPAAGTDVEAALDAAFPDTDPQVRETMAIALTDVAARLGPLTGVADASGGTVLTTTADGVAVLGTTTLVLDGAGANVLAAGTVDQAALLVGDGEILYSLAQVNELTAQVDALQPFGTDLVPRTCVDTATVGTPLAFHLDARDGELLLFRVDDDAGDPELQLRDPIAGEVWASNLDVATAPPGVLAERLSGGLGAELVVAARRTAPGEDEPVVTAMDRRDGEIRWTADRDALGLTDDGPTWTDVLAVTDEVVVLLVAPDADRGRGTLVALEAGTGERRWDTADLEVLDVADADVADGALHLVVREGEDSAGGDAGGDGIGDRRVRLTDGEVTSSFALPGATAGAVAGLDAVTTVVVTDDGLAVVDPVEASGFSTPFTGGDVLAHPGGVTLLLTGPDGGAIAATFDPMHG